MEIINEADMMNCVPVIMNTVLQQHEFIVDVIVFVKQGMLAKSRIQEKQRHKVATAYRLSKLYVSGCFDCDG